MASKNASTEKMLEKTLGEGFDLFKKNFVALIVAALVAALCSIFIITIPPMFFGLAYMAVAVARGQTVKITDVFKGFNYLVRSYALFIVGAILIGIGLVFLVLPGLALMILFQYAIAVAIMEDRGGIDSLQRSVELARKNLPYSIVLWILLAIVNGVGTRIGVGWLITYPFSLLVTVKAAEKLGAKLE